MKRTILGLLAATLVAAAAPALADKTAGDIIDDTTVNASVKAALVETKGVPAS